jgi:hypothetical protein
MSINYLLYLFLKSAIHIATCRPARPIVRGFRTERIENRFAINGRFEFQSFPLPD